jgi:hypothetical protein
MKEINFRNPDGTDERIPVTFDENAEEDTGWGFPIRDDELTNSFMGLPAFSDIDEVPIHLGIIQAAHIFIGDIIGT